MERDIKISYRKEEEDPIVPFSNEGIQNKNRELAWAWYKYYQGSDQAWVVVKSYQGKFS